MILKLTSKGCQISEITHQHIKEHVKKFIQSLPHFKDDSVVFRLNFLKNKNKYHPQRIHHHTHKTYADIKPAIAFYLGSITFRLNKSWLYVHFKGQTIVECIDRGFKLIFKELEKYKDKHFASESEYPNRASIRRMGAYD